MNIYICICVSRGTCRCSASRMYGSTLGMSGPNLEPGTIRVYVTNGVRNGLCIGRKVGLCPGSRRRLVLGSAHAFS